MSEPPLLVIVGPTASGKTALSLALAEALGGEILSADSVQIYRHFDIGSGKPSAAELERVPHHFIGTHDPLDRIDAAGWAALAETRLAEILARGRRPIVCGGSFLWVRALLFGLAPAPAANPELRAEHHRIVDELGRAELHRRLGLVDSESAGKLAPNDFVRVSRALEVFELTGIKMSQWQAEHGFRQAKRDYHLLGVARERVELDARIRDRAAKMLASGLVAEVVGLCERRYSKARAMGSVGYREVYAAVTASGAASPEVYAAVTASGAASPEVRAAVTASGAASPEVRAAVTASGAASPEVRAAVTASGVNEVALLDEITRKTRIFARHQRTWLRDEQVHYLAPELTHDEGALLKAVRDFLDEPGQRS